VRAPVSLAGLATAGSETTARITWRLEPCSSGTSVELTVVVRRLGIVDRALLGLGWP
jgi:hypothetical protein